MYMLLYLCTFAENFQKGWKLSEILKTVKFGVWDSEKKNFILNLLCSTNS